MLIDEMKKFNRNPSESYKEILPSLTINNMQRILDSKIMPNEVHKFAKSIINWASFRVKANELQSLPPRMLNGVIVCISALTELGCEDEYGEGKRKRHSTPFLEIAKMMRSTDTPTLTNAFILPTTSKPTPMELKTEEDLE